ncbi:MAG: hypothetical protein KC643_32615, partial [Nitrospira sp.]|nr:hypothetical protein [Nitrospira sp.]
MRQFEDHKHDSLQYHAMKISTLRTLCLWFLLIPVTESMGQEIGWETTVGEAVSTLQHYLQINTTNPPGDITEAADFL